MGKGLIISGGTGGLYSVKLIYAYRSRIEAKILKAEQGKTAVQAEIVKVDAAITAKNAQIAAEDDLKKKASLMKEKETLLIRKSVLELQIVSLDKQIAYLTNNMPADPTISTYCMDLPEAPLSGYVGTAEIPGEPVTVLIRPGYSGRAVYSGPRDGQLMPAIAGEPNQVLLNWMMLPGWQRHKPIYRTGTVVAGSLDFDGNTCSVCMDQAYSSQQSLPAIDGLTVGECGSTTEFDSRVADFCSRNPTHPFCTNTEDGSEIFLTDAQQAQLDEANDFVNRNYGRENDKSGFKMGDVWDSMPPGGAGDCEDFSLTKMKRLVDEYGWNPRDLKIAVCFTKEGNGHAVLVVRTQNKGLMVLDVNYDGVVASTKLPYRIDKIALTKSKWRGYTRRLDLVPIEYMNCNAGAFADNDKVVVQFIDQKWTTPKVVGFVENPQSCTMDALILGNVNYNNPGYSFYKYGFDADQWQIMGEIPGHKYYGSEGWILRGYMFTSSSGSNAFIFGGIDNVYNPYDPLETTPIPECASPPGCFNSIYADANKYSQSGGTWTNLQDMPEGRAYGQGFKIGTKHYVVAGSTFHVSGPSYLMSGSPKNSNFEYDEIALTWATKQGCPSSRQNSRGWMINNIGFTFGGRDTNFTSQFVAPNFPKGLHGYNQITDAWASYQDMLRGRNNMAAGKINGDGYVFPGYAMEGESGDCALYSETPGAGLFTTRWLDKYNEASNSWSMVSNLFSSTDFSYSAGIAECGYYGLWYFFNSGPFGSLVNWADYNALTSAASFRSGNPSEVGQFGQESKSFIGV